LIFYVKGDEEEEEIKRKKVQAEGKKQGKRL